MNLATYDWPNMTRDQRRRVMIDLGYYLLDQSDEPLDRIALNRKMRAYAAPALAKHGIQYHRRRWLNWASLVVNEFADHARANNPRAVEATRYKALTRLERLAVKLERSVDKLLDFGLEVPGRTEGFTEDVRAATMAVNSLVNIDKIRAAVYRWADRVPDELSQDADKAETLRMLSTWLTEATPETRARVIELAQSELADEDTLLEEIGFRH